MQRNISSEAFLPDPLNAKKRTKTGWREDVDEENVMKRIPKILPAESASEKKMRDSC
jgi:hypothetical protein